MILVQKGCLNAGKSENEKKKGQPVSQSVHLSSNRDDLDGPIRFGSALACNILVVDSDALRIRLMI